MHEAIQFCHEVKKLGYKVFAQAVSITSYSDRELLDLVDLVNDLEPYAMSLVDTYGLLHQDNLLHYFQLLNYNLKPSATTPTITSSSHTQTAWKSYANRQTAPF